MKTTIHILLLYFCIGAILPKGDFSQLVKINDLMEHYDLHQKEAWAVGKTVSLFDFFYLHFVEGGDDHHDNENQHESLPFQNITSTTFQLIQLTYTTNTHQEIAQNNTINFRSKFYSEEAIFSIFHPPTNL